MENFNTPAILWLKEWLFLPSVHPTAQLPAADANVNKNPMIF